MTDYLGQVSASGQVEARWRFSERWGLVGFAGSGYIGSSFSEVNERKGIPSYGAGIRFMVLPAKRINIRIDAAWCQPEQDQPYPPPTPLGNLAIMRRAHETLLLKNGARWQSPRAQQTAPLALP